MEDLREVKLRVWGEEACRNNTLLSEDSVNTNFTLCAGYTSGMMSGCRVSLVSGNELFLVSFERSSPLACDICCQYSLIYYCLYLFIYSVLYWNTFETFQDYLYVQLYNHVLPLLCTVTLLRVNTI